MEAAEAQSRRGLEETVRLLDEALEKMTVRAEREAKERHTAERLAATVQGELNALQKEMSIRFNTQQAEESDKLQRELREPSGLRGRVVRDRLHTGGRADAERRHRRAVPRVGA